ncbi:hypothetical protein SAMN05421820_11936 [Pedobacter steynii]|uniref:Uncharacterized protein n=1 Tax=Pedobacter steynii TaxID=430522 RepID=A0A1H0LZ14_9SPHI|nr:DUF6266 family protein [Pedobacter steynii]NQX43591.1 hypothetical protein [Pedobacter steynii]SDO73216.1 hypothetical protein SAMN05421820_11936 [Pedobacter steynii]
MAKAPNGPLGALNGKLSNLVFYILNGQPVVRTIGDPGKPSRNQLANRQAMSVTMDMVRTISEFTNVSFELEVKGTVRNTHNLATSYIKKHAVKGEYPNLSVDYAKVILSNGTLPGANDLKIEKNEKGVLVSWDSRDRHNDIVMILLYHPLKKMATPIINACRRDAGSYFVDLHQELVEEPIEAYICFRAANGKAISDSQYIGNLNGEMESKEEREQKEKYASVKQRFDVVKADYLQQITDNRGNPVDSKAFRNLEREYEVLKKKLEHLPGKPGG